MKLSISLSAALLFSLSCAMNNHGGLPYEGLLTQEQVENYTSLLGVCTIQDLANIIRMDLEELGVIQPGDQVLQFADFSDDNILGEVIPLAGHDVGQDVQSADQLDVEPIQADVQPIQRPAHLPYQHLLTIEEVDFYNAISSAMGEDYNIEETIFEMLEGQERLDGHGPNGPPPQPQPQPQLQMADVGGHHGGPMVQMVVDGPNGVQVVNVPMGMNPVEFLLRMIQQDGPQLDQGMVDPFGLDEESFKLWVTRRENFTMPGFAHIAATCDFNNAQSERVYRMMLSAAQFETIQSFSFLRNAMFKSLSAESGVNLALVVEEITKSGKDPRFLEIYLEDCTPLLASGVGQQMTSENQDLHQVFVNCCKTNIPPSIASKLINVTLPPGLLEMIHAMEKEDNGHLCLRKVLGQSGGSDQAIVMLHTAGPIQVAGFFYNPQAASILNGLGDAFQLEALAETIKELDENNVFCVIHLDSSTNQATIFRSKHLGPAIAIMHADGEGCADISPELDDFYSQTGVLSITEEVKPGDVIVGVSEELILSARGGLKNGILASLAISFSLDSVNGIVDFLSQAIQVHNTSQLLVGVVPAVEEVTDQENITSSTADLGTNSSSTEGI